MELTPKDIAWNKIFDQYDILSHNFEDSPFVLSAEQIKKACKAFDKTSQKEPRILCKQDTREDRPNIFVENGLFIDICDVVIIGHANGRVDLGGIGLQVGIRAGI